MAQQKPVNEPSAPEYNDYTNIKDQIARQYFAEYDAQRLTAITTALGCDTTDCPQLIAATDIKYNLLNSAGRRYVGRGEKINKVVFHSADNGAENYSALQQSVAGMPYFMKLIQSMEVIITKTKQITSNKGVNILVYKKKCTTTFTQQEEEKYSEINETIIFYPSQKVMIAPLTKMNFTFNFFQYDDINNYFLDFQIANNSTLTHPEIGTNSKLVNVTKPLGDFLEKHINFLSTLKYESETALKLVVDEGRFVLKNFPTIEKLTNYGVDVNFGRVEVIEE